MIIQVRTNMNQKLWDKLISRFKVKQEIKQAGGFRVYFVSIDTNGGYSYFIREINKITDKHLNVICSLNG